MIRMLLNIVQTNKNVLQRDLTEFITIPLYTICPYLIQTDR